MKSVANNKTKGGSFMKKFFVSFAVAMALTTATTVTAMAEGLNCSKITPGSIERQLPFPPLPMKILQNKPVADGAACEIIARMPVGKTVQFIPIYVLRDNSVVLGTRFKNKVNAAGDKLAALYNQAKKKIFETVKNELNGIAIATYAPKKAIKDRVLYAFVDPLCPFCHMADPHLEALADKYGYTIKIIPFIVHGLPAYDKAESFICNNGTYADWIDNKFGENKTCPKATNLLKKAQMIDMQLQLEGTPTFATQQGNFVFGANLQQLTELMSKGE